MGCLMVEWMNKTTKYATHMTMMMVAATFQRASSIGYSYQSFVSPGLEPELFSTYFTCW